MVFYEVGHWQCGDIMKNLANTTLKAIATMLELTVHLENCIGTCSTCH